jgi:hypothetical protein
VARAEEVRKWLNPAGCRAAALGLAAARVATALAALGAGTRQLDGDPESAARRLAQLAADLNAVEVRKFKIEQDGAGQMFAISAGALAAAVFFAVRLYRLARPRAGRSDAPPPSWAQPRSAAARPPTD